MPGSVLPATRVVDDIPAAALVTRLSNGTNGCVSTWGAADAGCPPPCR